MYLAECKLCRDKCYTGRTVQPLNKQINRHRQGFNKLVAKRIMNEKLCDSDDTFSLGIHLLQEHGDIHIYGRVQNLHFSENVE